MKILVTGHKGFIGSHMVRALAEHDVRTFEWGEQWPEVAGLDWVIHIGAISSTVEQDVQKILKQNYEFSVWLFESCKHHKVNMQYSSSASVYGLNTTFSEDAALDPRNHYAHSKLLFEHYANKYTHGNIVQGFRYFNVYGPEGEEHKGDQASPFYKFKKQAEEQGYINLFEGSEDFKRDFIHVSEIVNLHKQFLNVKESGVWNFGTGNTMSFRQVAEQYNVPTKTIPMPEVLKGNYQSYTCADMTKTRNTLCSVS